MLAAVCGRLHTQGVLYAVATKPLGSHQRHTQETNPECTAFKQYTSTVIGHGSRPFTVFHYSAEVTHTSPGRLIAAVLEYNSEHTCLCTVDFLTGKVYIGVRTIVDEQSTDKLWEEAQRMNSEVMFTVLLLDPTEARPLFTGGLGASRGVEFSEEAVSNELRVVESPWPFSMGRDNNGNELYMGL